MESVYTTVFYVIAFLSVYIQIFFLVTFLEKRRYISGNLDDLDLDHYPTITVTVPCYNEEKTIEKTVKSLLSLDYPQDKLTIFLIDDGSRDNTWNILKKFEEHSNIKIFHKENGGKHTALNLGLEHSTSEFFGCLDSDSFVHPQSLKRIVKYFQNDESNMAVIPSIIIHNPKNMVQKAQTIEYTMTVYTKKMLGFVGGIHVTPGPLSIFRKKVFDDLGPYRKAHNTEDQEIALRMHEHGYKIDHCPDAYVYTIAPNTISKLYNQRLRWMYGFFKNMIDYRRLIFRKKYGTIALLTIPSGLISILGVVFLFCMFLINVTDFVYKKFVQIKIIGFHYGTTPKFDWFFVPTQATFLFIIFLYLMVIVSITMGQRISKNKIGSPIRIIYFIAMYSVLAPFWLLKAIYNTIRSKESSWTFERRVTN